MKNAEATNTTETAAVAEQGAQVAPEKAASKKAASPKKGAPKSEIDAGSLRMLGYPDMTIKLRDGIVISIKLISKSEQAAQSASNATGPRPPQMDTVKRQLDDAVAQVKTIINQPVPYVPATPETCA